MKINIQFPLYALLFTLSFLLNISRSFSQVQTGKSYVNITKGTAGGTFEPGDILEIRSAIAVGSSLTISQVRYNDTINSSFTYISNSLKILTNEGLAFRSYTDASNDDLATYNSIANNIRINLGNTASNATSTANTSATGGTIAYNNKPSFHGGVCIMVASFRIKINIGLAYNTIITLPGGAFRYTNSSNNPITVNFGAYKIMLFKNLGSCSNYVGSNAVIENNGTFGSGTTQNRSASAIVPGYAYTNFSANQPNDGSYGIANNTSATGATDNGVTPTHSSRVFSIWDIIGDHTGATNPAAGNVAKAPGTIGGYMAVVNASYATSTAIQQSVSNLCPNTYYDFSAWFRNICSLCACDSNGNGATNTLFNGPYKPGVKPNLTYQLDGIDYYTTGDLPYTGLWENKGFTYLTGAAQTGFNLTIRNNSPGGGGNDWAVDDVRLSTCEPNVDLNLTPTYLACTGSQINLNVKVKCYFPNYTFFKWQKSIDSGTSWFDTAIKGDSIPTLVNGQWEYNASFPSFIASKSDSGQSYRVVVATTLANLASASCAYSNNQNSRLKIVSCSSVVNVQIKYFTGKVTNKKNSVYWVTSKEDDIMRYEIEKSVNGKDFVMLDSVKPWLNNAEANYNYTDKQSVNEACYYRLKAVGKSGLFVYSKTILLNIKPLAFNVINVTNPFKNDITINYILPCDGTVSFCILDTYGRPMLKLIIKGKKGLNTAYFGDLNLLSTGIYSITTGFDNIFITRRIIKIQ